MTPHSLNSLPRRTKRLISLWADTALIPFSLYAASALRYGTATPWRVMDPETLPLFPLLTVLGMAIVLGCRLHWIKVGTFENRAVLRIALAAVLLAGLAMAVSYTLALPAPRSVPLIFGAVFFLSSFGIRLAGQQVLASLEGRGEDRKPVAIYGAGAAGIQLAASLRQARETNPVVFIDDNPGLQGLMVGGLKVYPPSRLRRLIARHGIERILLAMPSISEARRDRLVQSLRSYPAELQVLPSYIDMMAERSLSEQLRTVAPDMLPGRETVRLDGPEIAKAYAGRVVMVTGAGGMVGAELCRQLLDCKPARIVMFDRNEAALWDILRDLQSQAETAGIPLVARLGSVTDPHRVTSVISEQGAEIILHTAAYRHGQLIEENPLEAAKVNVLGTRVVAEAALAQGAERFLLVSTDKAARAASLMGATKRMAELLLQDLQTRSPHTKFASVRFGESPGAAGSVLALMKKQINSGGPLTLCHADVERSFMPLAEATRLVLLAGAFTQGGEIFVLGKGNPQKIIDIARRMLALTGRSEKDPDTGLGDIAIEITGLRPGEMLHEEPLPEDGSLTETAHPQLLQSAQTPLSEIEIMAMLRELNAALAEADPDRLRLLVKTRLGDQGQDTAHRRA